MRRLFKPERDFTYYGGLLLLAGASFSLIWAIWRDAFEPRNFLVYFLVYGWGYLLLLKSDTDYRIGRLEEKMTEALAKISFFEGTLQKEAPEEELLVEDVGNEGVLPPRGELFQELWGEKTEDEEE